MICPCAPGHFARFAAEITGEEEAAGQRSFGGRGVRDGAVEAEVDRPTLPL